MSREVKRVPLDFDWPLDKVWHGYLMPQELHETNCPDCKNGYSKHAQHLHDLWYGYVPFDPVSTGSTPLRPDTPAVRAFAERNVAEAPDFYGTDTFAVRREAMRLARLWNGQWSHHLHQDDVDALVAAGRLMDFTHTWSRETHWQKKDPPYVPSAAEVNEWSLHGMGHDSINASVVISARCGREDIDDTCSTCEGHGSIESYPGQRAEAQAWVRSDPPEGEGWQLWETTTEGSPISPVFASAEELARWMSSPAREEDRVSLGVAWRFVDVGWAPTVVSTQAGVVCGVEAVGAPRGEAARDAES